MLLERYGAESIATYPNINATLVRSERKPRVPGLKVVRNLEVGGSHLTTADSGLQKFTIDPDKDSTELAKLQWGLRSVCAKGAWQRGFKGQGARIFILDSGFDLEHPELQHSYNLSLSRSFVPGTRDASFKGGRKIISHATHVAGIISASKDDRGITGVAPESEIVPVKVLDERYNNTGQLSWVLDGIIYAADNAASIINLSIGGVAPKSQSGAGQSATSKEVAKIRVLLNRAIAYATRKGSLVIVSAGNSGLSLVGRDVSQQYVFPAQSPKAFVVGSVAASGYVRDQTSLVLNQAPYSNFGPRVDLFAPGGGYDRDWLGARDACLLGDVARACWMFDLVMSTGANQSWYWSYGTSMATPHVSGLAATIISEMGQQASPAKIRQALKKRAQRLSTGNGGNQKSIRIASSGFCGSQ